MSLVTNIQSGFDALVAKVNVLSGRVGTLGNLTTTAKGDLVSAINEIDAAVDAAATSGGAAINDGGIAGATTWSSSKIASEDDAHQAAAITAANGYTDSKVAALVNSAPGTLDTLDELAQALGDDANFATSTATALGDRVAYSAQAKTEPQKAQARTNIDVYSKTDVGSLTYDFAAAVNAASTV